MQAHIDKINEMASVMKKAIEVDDGRLCEDEERIKQLEVKALDVCNINLCSFYENKKRLMCSTQESWRHFYLQPTAQAWKTRDKSFWLLSLMNCSEFPFKHMIESKRAVSFFGCCDKHPPVCQLV